MEVCWLTVPALNLPGPGSEPSQKWLHELGAASPSRVSWPRRGTGDHRAGALAERLMQS